MEQYTVSARGKTLEESIETFLAESFSSLEGKIDSVFGFADYTPLYGGRPFYGEELSDADVRFLYGKRIGIRLPLTNGYLTPKIWESQIDFLEKFHKKGNSVITVNDEFARFVKEEFPLYQVELSVIREIKSLDEISAALELYDTVVLHGKWNVSEELAKIPEKGRIRLFLTTGCGYNCPAKICYASFSKYNLSLSGEVKCSVSKLERQQLGMISFEVRPFIEKGFSKFKVVRLISNNVVPPIF
jgi:hypothetical protein